MDYNYPNYVNPYMYQQQQPYQMPMQQQQQIPQIQNGGFISVRNETEARNYPVAPGNSITFKDETSPYVYTKTMGFSQLDRPIFERYKLVKEESSEDTKAIIADEVIDNTVQKKLEGQISQLWKEINSLKETTRRPQQKKENK